MIAYLDLACDYLGVEKGSVMASHITDDEVIVVIDRGIKGCPKYRIPLSDLVVITEAASEPVADELLPVPAVIDLNGDGLSYRELQALAKEAGIPANQSAYDLREALEEYTDDE